MKNIDLDTLANVTGGAASSWSRPGQWNNTQQWNTNSTKPTTGGGSWSGNWNNNQWTK